MAQEPAGVLKTMTESLKNMNEELTFEREKFLCKEVRAKSEVKSGSGGSERRKERLMDTAS